MDEELIALNRFGLGRRPGERVRRDPATWLLDQLDRAPRVLGRLSSLEILASLGDYQLRRLDMRDTDPMAAKAINDEKLRFSREEYDRRVSARFAEAVESETPFFHRLLHFWSNHFAVSADSALMKALAGGFEDEAIRPHVAGRFEDMLAAVEQHAAMLVYLDQARSVGPNSAMLTRPGAPRGDIGINENLAREVLELHTLGVNGGYTQTDVRELAMALTGWTIAIRGAVPFPRRLLRDREPGTVFFEDLIHEPGTRRILGRGYTQQGQAQSRAILADLSRHPATARHIAFKLARHFLADDPPQSVVRRLEAAFLDSGGYLPAVYEELLQARESWDPAPAKFRTPWQWSIAAVRGLGGYGGDLMDNMPANFFQRALDQLGQPAWLPRSPAGFDDTAGHWAAPDALVRRVGFAEQLVRRAPAELDARDLAGQLFGAFLSSQTRGSLAASQDPRTGLALLLVSPEMLRC